MNRLPGWLLAGAVVLSWALLAYVAVTGVTIYDLQGIQNGTE